MEINYWKYLKVFFAILSFSSLIACGVSADRSPEAVAVNLVKASLNNDVETIKSLYHSDIILAIEKKSGANFEKAIKVGKKNTDNEKSYKVSMVDCSKNDDLIIVVIKQENLDQNVSKRNKDKYYAISLADENGEWKVVEVNN